MPALAIRARFPLGIYLGHRHDGEASPFPDTARLHAALLHSAGKGSLAQVVGSDLRPSAPALSALRWLEDHPPSALGMPASVSVAAVTARGGAVTESFRDEGVFDTAQRDVPARRKVRKHQSDAVAVDGDFGWAWDEEAPEEVVATITALCEDVSCLGEADTPVILEVGTVDITHFRDAAKTAFPDPGGLGVRTPIPGRVDELESDYEMSRPVKALTEAADRHAWQTQPGSHKPSATCVQQVIYRSTTPPVPELPWVAATALPLAAAIDPAQRVPWCVAVHRALAAYLGDLSSPVLTGRYATGVKPPANRISVQFVESEALGELAGEAKHGAFLVMAPAGAPPEELALIERECLAKLRKVYRPHSGAVDLGPSFSVDVERFWPAPAPGFMRYWRPVPGMVAETRPQRGGQPWSLEDAALLSVGHLFRDRLVDVGGGPDRYRRIVAQVRQWGVTAHNVRRIADSRVERFAHKVPAGIVVQPFTAQFDLSALVPPTALLAVGQSRHLGGGLLVPVDESVAARSLYGWRSSC